MDVNDTTELLITFANAIDLKQVSLDPIYDPDIVTIMNITANDTIPSSTIIYALDSGNAAITQDHVHINTSVTDT